MYVRLCNGSPICSVARALTLFSPHPVCPGLRALAFALLVLSHFLLSRQHFPIHAQPLFRRCIGNVL